MGASCLLVYGDAPDGVLDQHDDAPPPAMLDQLESYLAAIDVDALRVSVRAEEARRACRALVDGLVKHEIYELARTRDPRTRARREAKLLDRIKAVKL